MTMYISSQFEGGGGGGGETTKSRGKGEFSPLSPYLEKILYSMEVRKKIYVQSTNQTMATVYLLWSNVVATCTVYTCSY